MTVNPKIRPAHMVYEKYIVKKSKQIFVQK